MKAIYSLLLTLLCTGLASGVEVRTYRIAESDTSTLRYGGGLADFDVTAALKGTLQVTIDDDETVSVSKFELTIHNLHNTGTFDIEWAEGDSLAERLNQDAGMLEGTLMQESGLDRLLLSTLEPSFGESALVTYLTIEHSSPTSATLLLTSSYLYAEAGAGPPLRPVLDTPTMRIQVSPGIGVPVQLVPEPGGIVLFAAGCALLVTRRCRCGV